MDLTLDSNVLVYSFVPPLHKNKEKREEFGKDAALEIEDSAEVILFDSDLKERAIDYAIRIRAGGFDNIIAITSILYGTTLITNDKPFHDKLTPFLDEYQFEIEFFRDLNLDALE